MSILLVYYWQCSVYGRVYSGTGTKCQKQRDGGRLCQQRSSLDWILLPRIRQHQSQGPSRLAGSGCDHNLSPQCPSPRRLSYRFVSTVSTAAHTAWAQVHAASVRVSAALAATHAEGPTTVLTVILHYTRLLCLLTEFCSQCAPRPGGSSSRMRDSAQGEGDIGHGKGLITLLKPKIDILHKFLV